MNSGRYFNPKINNHFPSRQILHILTNVRRVEPFTRPSHVLPIFKIAGICNNEEGVEWRSQRPRRSRVRYWLKHFLSFQSRLLNICTSACTRNGNKVVSLMDVNACSAENKRVRVFVCHPLCILYDRPICEHEPASQPPSQPSPAYAE